MKVARLGLLAFVLLGLAACSRVPEVVKIGVAQPLTGPRAHLGLDMLHGVELAVREINAEGLRIDGQPVQLQIVSVDDQSDPALGEQVAHQLVDAKVVAVVGHLNSGVSIRAAPVYAAGHIPQFAISTQPRYTQLGLPTTLRLVANDNLQGRAMGSYAATMLGGSRVAVVDDASSYGKALADVAEQALQDKRREVVLRRSLDDRTLDFKALAAELRSVSPDILVTTLADFQIVGLVQALAANGLSQLKIVAADSAKTDKLLAQPLPLEVFCTSPVLEPLEFPRGRAFVDTYRRAYGSAPVYGAHYAYDAVHLLAGAMRRSGSVDGKAIITKLRELEFIAPVTNVMKFAANGEQAYASVGVYRPRGGRWEPLISSDRW